MSDQSTREIWGSRLGFILAAAGSAIGLGNIWKFPYITYENRGGSFVLIYLVCIAAVGFPIMVAEIILGRSTQRSPVGAFLKSSPSKTWSLVGGLGVASGFVILSYYSVVAGWAVFYFGRCVSWSIEGATPGTQELNAYFGQFLTDGGLQVLFHALFMGVTIFVVAFGVKRGIERVAKTLMPVLVLILFVLCINSTRTEGFSEAMAFLFQPGPIDADGVLEALGHSFFTLSLGMGAMITYGSYMGRKDSIAGSATIVCVLDTVIALMACVIMFSIIFSVDDPSQFKQSATILFTTLPSMFADLPGGTILSPAFYFLVALAALTSTISLLEVVVAFFIDQLGWKRRSAAVVVGLVIFSFGILAALSNGAWERASNVQLADKATGVFDILDYLASNWMLPVGGLGIAIFAGWFLSRSVAREELTHEGRLFSGFPVWQFLVRFVGPIAICYILYQVLFVGVKFN